MIRRSQLALKLCYLFLAGQLMACSGQPAKGTRPIPLVGGGCDGCELMYIGIPDSISSIDTSKGWYEKGQKLLVTGTVYRTDGITPAADVIVYYWQTDASGLYSPAPGMDARVKHHGHIRGWIKTDSSGRYSIYTIRPAPYPNDVSPAHIHLSVKEPGLPNEYYVDDLNFDDDPLLIPSFKRYPQENRGGSGVMRVLIKNDLQIAEHDIVLGLNIPDYPTSKAQAAIKSGLAIGQDQPSFGPYHVHGPDKGSTACPVCKYGRHYGILFFKGGGTGKEELKSWLGHFETMANTWQDHLKVYIVAAIAKDDKEQMQIAALEQLGNELGLKRLALTVVPSFADQGSDVYLNKIDPSAKNTIIVFRNRRIIHKWVNLPANEISFNTIQQLLKEREGIYFNLPGMPHGD